METISRYFLFGFLSLVDLPRMLSSWTLDLELGGLEVETCGMFLLLSSIPGGAVGTPLLSSCTNPWSFPTTNSGALLIPYALLALWLWALSFPALFTVLFNLELWKLCTFALGTNFAIGFNTFCTFAFGIFSITYWDTFSLFVWDTLCTFGDFCVTNNTYFTFSLLGALGTVFEGIPASLGCILLLLFSPCSVFIM